MAGKGTVYPIPCRNCGKLAPLAVMPGKHHLKCTGCGAATDVDVRPAGPDLEIRTSLAPRKAP